MLSYMSRECDVWLLVQKDTWQVCTNIIQRDDLHLNTQFIYNQTWIQELLCLGQNQTALVTRAKGSITSTSPPAHTVQWLPLRTQIREGERQNWVWTRLKSFYKDSVLKRLLDSKALKQPCKTQSHPKYILVLHETIQPLKTVFVQKYSLELL